MKNKDIKGSFNQSLAFLNGGGGFSIREFIFDYGDKDFI